MVDYTATLRRLSQLAARVVDAERAAGMSRSDVARARARMELDIVANLEGAGDDVTTAFVLFVRVAALHSRLHNAFDYQTQSRWRPKITDVPATQETGKPPGTEPSLH